VPAIRKCYEVGQTPCSETTALTDVVHQGQVALPTGITRTTDLLTIAMTTNAQAQTYTLTVTMSTPNSGAKTWSTVTINVGICVIASIDVPTNPGMQEYIMFYSA